MKRTFALLVLFSAGFVSAADWPQFRGANHDSTSPEKIAQHWPPGGPRQIWKTQTPGGFSSFAVGGGKAFTLVLRDFDGAEQEACLALDANTGQELWAKSLDVANYDGGGNSGASGNKGGDGPRSTPSIDGSRVYVTSGNLKLYCFDAGTGAMIWKRDLLKENGGKNIQWKNAASPLLDGNLVFIGGGGPGQALLALDKTSGKIVWKGENDIITHSTPTAATILGIRQVIFFTRSGLVSLEEKTGSVLWRYPFRFNVSTAISPVVAGDIVFCSAGYGVGSSACKITKSGNTFTATQLWANSDKGMSVHWSTPVYKDGCIYGLFGFKEFGTCPLKCVQVATGKVMWSQDGFGPGGTILVGGQLLVLGDAGQLVLVKTTPAAYTELARAQVLAGKCWSTPVVSNGRVYARSTKEAVCLDVAAK